MDPLSFIIVYAILMVAGSISSNVASSGVFELLKPKIFKQKEPAEVKEALEEVINNLRKEGYFQESRTLAEKMNEIIEKTMEIYEEYHEDLTKIKDEIIATINSNTDERKGNLEAIEELKRIILGYGLPKPYEIVEKGLDVRGVLRPPFEVDPVERPERDELIAQPKNIFVIGRPGIGKTLLLQQITQGLNYEKIVWMRPHFSDMDTNRLLMEDLSGKVLVVWDDVQNNPDIFYRTVHRMRDKLEDMRVLSAARSTELENVEKIPIQFWEDFTFLRKEIPLLNSEQKKELIRRCSEKTGIAIEKDAVGRLAEKSDGTPLYIISVFLDEKYRKEGKILMGDVEKLPGKVVNLWKRYYGRLKENEKALIRCLMILSRVGVRGFKHIVEGLYVFGGSSFSSFCDALEGLKRQSWIVEVGEVYECHDVQIEGVPSRDEMLSLVKRFVISGNLDGYSQFLLDFGISFFHSGEIGRAKDYSERIFHVAEAIRFIEGSLDICRDLGLKAELSMSLNNASSFYSDLSSLQQTREEKLKSIKTAVEYIEEAIKIRRDLGLKAELSTSLNNASLTYLRLTTYKETQEKRETLHQAISYIENAIQTRKDLGLSLDLADSLAISVFIFDSYLEFDSTVFSKAMKNCDEAIDIYLKFKIEKYCIILPFAMKYHQVMYDLTKSEEHQTILQTYQFLYSHCQ